ncbi:MAG: DHCW motif cupin fold protein, partial [Acidovorax sp.]|uniref:DHCW motif cupin fold protein n=1 Tax=Acidovorax sp. TaxID=1872122 RepID=UPI00391D39A1
STAHRALHPIPPRPLRDPWEIANTFLDHWCTKGHVLLCLSGELHTELADGRQYTLTPGMSYQVADNAEPHRSTSPQGATLFIVD